MKKITFFILILLTTDFIASCKKGENDPAFSLRTRKNRLTGNWEVTSYQKTVNDTTFIYSDGNEVKKVGEFSFQPLPKIITYNFDRLGAYTINIEINYPQNFNNSANPAYTSTYLHEGTWNFVGGEGQTPAKSKLLLMEEYREFTLSTGGSNVQAIEFDGQNTGLIYNIDELKYNKITLTYYKETSTDFGKNIESLNLVLQRL